MSTLPLDVQSGCVSGVGGGGCRDVKSRDLQRSRSRSRVFGPDLELSAFVSQFCNDVQGKNTTTALYTRCWKVGQYAHDTKTWRTYTDGHYNTQCIPNELQRQHKSNRPNAIVTATIRRGFDGHSTAHQRSLSSQWR